MSAKLRLFILVGILLLAALLRIYHIDLLSLWIDEGFTWNFTRYHDPMRILRQDVHPPLYFFAVRVWVQVAGTSVFAMRFFSVLPGMLSVAVVTRIAEEALRQRGQLSQHRYTVPLLAALLLALSDAEIFLAQEFRSYTWHVLFVSLSMWGFLRWGRTNGRGWLLLWMGSTIALVYTFYLGAFLGVAQGLYALGFLPPVSQSASFRQILARRIQAILVLALCAAALIPWLAMSLPEQSGNLSYSEWIRLDALSFWLNDFRVRYFTRQWVLMIGLFALGAVLIRDEGARRRFTVDRVGILLLLWFFVPLLLTVLVNEIVPIYQPRRVTQIVPAIVLLTAFGLAQFPRRARWFFVVVIVVYGLTNVDFWRYKQPWRDFAQETRPYIAPGVPILLELAGDDYAPRYHFEEALPDSYDFLLDTGVEPGPQSNVIIGLTTWRDLQPDLYRDGLPPLLNTMEHLWLFYWSDDQGATQWLDQFGFDRTAAFTAPFNPEVFLYRYDRLPEQPIGQFENGITLEYAAVYDRLLVELLWSNVGTLERDYTVSAFLLDEAGQLVAQKDSQPFFNQRPTSQWSPGETVFDPRILEVVNGNRLPPGTYTAGIVLYSHEAGQLTREQTLQGDDHLLIGEITIRQ